MFNHPYILLATKEPLDDESIKEWFKCVRDVGPNGIISAIELRADNKQYKIYYRIIKGLNYYIVVLTRDLSTEEAIKISNQLNNSIPEGNFEIRWSQHPTIKNVGKYEVTEDMLKTIALEAAKRNHNTWLNERVAEGWRYSQGFNQLHKTSPMCKDWDSLPEKYKLIEYKRMASLIEILDEMKLKLVTDNLS